jgi:hypothetical protein
VLLYYYPETVYPPVVYFKIKVFLNNWSNKWGTNRKL